MIEEPFRWVEAIANRREYIEHQLEAGSPIVGLSYRDGILLFTLGRERQKIFEIYDRIAMGGIGHPGDIERLRMAAIEVTSTEGFTRSAQDVSLRRLANYSLSPALKGAFEQIYGPPYLARLLIVELGRGNDPDLFVRLDYDGSIHSSGGGYAMKFEHYGVISGTAASTAAMDDYLKSRGDPDAPLDAALEAALNAWTVGHLTQAEQDGGGVQDDARILESRRVELDSRTVEAAVLDRGSRLPITYRLLSPEDLKALKRD
jgi:proteasome alpha subunit